MRTILHDYTINTFKNNCNIISKTLLPRILFVQASDSSCDNFVNESPEKKKELITKYSGPPPELDPHLCKWIWSGTYAGRGRLPTYRNQNVVRVLYKQFIDNKLPDNRKLTVFTSPVFSDVNPYCVGMSITPHGVGRLTYNMRKSPIDMLFTNIPIPKDIESSELYPKALAELQSSGFIELGFMFREEARQYLIMAGYPIELVTFLIDKEIPNA